MPFTDSATRCTGRCATVAVASREDGACAGLSVDGPAQLLFSTGCNDSLHAGESQLIGHEDKINCVRMGCTNLTATNPKLRRKYTECDHRGAMSRRRSGRTVGAAVIPPSAPPAGVQSLSEHPCEGADDSDVYDSLVAACGYVGGLPNRSANECAVRPHTHEMLSLRRYGDSFTFPGRH